MRATGQDAEASGIVQGGVPVEWKKWDDELHVAVGKLTRLRSAMQVVGQKTLITFAGNPYHEITYRLATNGIGYSENGDRGARAKCHWNANIHDRPAFCGGTMGRSPW